jgi:RNA polymerase sigma-70 factor (ECF subfamily)
MGRWDDVLGQRTRLGAPSPEWLDVSGCKAELGGGVVHSRLDCREIPVSQRALQLTQPAVSEPPRADPLLDRLAAGEIAALGELSGAYRARIQRFVRAYAQVSPEVADDIAQQALLETLRTAHRFEGRSRLATWLFGVAKNLCRTHLRRREDATDPDARVWRCLPDPGKSPHELFETVERAELVRRALEGLPATHRAVLVLREWEELPYEGIAEVLGVPVGTVRSRLHAARALLAERLLETCGGRP